MATLSTNISSLSVEGKFEMLDAIWEDFESQPSSLSAEQAEELDRRIGAYEKNPQIGTPWEQVKAGLPQSVNLPVTWSDEAKAEFYKAEQWYADISLQLAERFLQTVGSTVRIIEASLLRFSVVYRERRRAGVKRFSL